MCSRTLPGCRNVDSVTVAVHHPLRAQRWAAVSARIVPTNAIRSMPDVGASYRSGWFDLETGMATAEGSACGRGCRSACSGASLRSRSSDSGYGANYRTAGAPWDCSDRGQTTKAVAREQHFFPRRERHPAEVSNFALFTGDASAANLRLYARLH